MKKIGYIYILSNEYMPGLVKIGFTDRDPVTRSRELSSHTGVPGKFNIEKSWEVLGAAAIEAAIFEALASLRLDGREFFKFSAPEKAINRVSSILLKLGELDAKGETVPAKKRLAKQKRELQKEQDRLSEYKGVELAWESEQLKYKQWALSQVERRLQYSLHEAEARHKRTSDTHKRLFRPSGWFMVVVIMTPPVGWILFGIYYLIEQVHKDREDSHYSKVQNLKSEVDKLLLQVKVDYFKERGCVLKGHRKSARF